MQKSRLIRILKTFSKKELRELKKWIHSPVHNQREDVSKLYEYLLNKKNLFSEERLDKKIVWKHLFSQHPFDDAKMRQCIHFLLKTIEAFLVFEEIQSDETFSTIALARNFRRRKLEKSHEKTMATALAIQQKSQIRNKTFYANEYLLQDERYSFERDIKNVQDQLNLQEMSDALDVSYILDKLYQSCHTLSHQTVYKKEYSIGLLSEILDYVEKNNLLELPAVAIYFYIYKTMIDKNNETHFFNLKEEIFLHGLLFPKNEISDIYLMAINYCVGRLNSGKKVFVREAFELYKHGFEHEGLINEDQRISHVSFQNTVTIGIKLDEFDWVEKFIINYERFLEDNIRESIKNICLAGLNYKRRDYDKALELLHQYEHKDVLINFNAKFILLKIYYETEEIKALESLLGSISAYIQRKKIIGYHKAVYKNTVSLTKKLLRVNPFSKEDKEKLKADIQKANPLTGSERQWLLEQLEKL